MDEINKTIDKIAMDHKAMNRRIEKVIRDIKDKAEKEILDIRNELLLYKSQRIKIEMNADIKDFKSWLLEEGINYYEEDTPHYDLYLDIQRDKEFPVSTNFDNMYLYMLSKTHDRNVLSAFVVAYEEYLLYKNRILNQG